MRPKNKRIPLALYDDEPETFILTTGDGELEVCPLNAQGERPVSLNKKCVGLVRLLPNQAGGYSWQWEDSAGHRQVLMGYSARDSARELYKNSPYVKRLLAESES